MATHLSHSVPWNGLSHHLSFIRENKAVYGHPTSLFPRGELRQETDGLHFVRVLVDTIREFSSTERRKHPSVLEQSQPLFADALLDHAMAGLEEFESNNNRCLPLSPAMQDVAYWKRRGSEGFCTGDGDLADAVKYLIQQHQSEALLRLCQAAPLADLFNLSWGHGFGVDLQAYHSLRIYLLLNLVYSVQQREVIKGNRSFSIFEMDLLQREVVCLMENNDYSAQFIAHRQFWQRFVEEKDIDGHSVLVFQDPAEVDGAALKQYLASCFRDLYLYDMLLCECGRADTRDYWLREIILTVNYMFPPLSLPDITWSPTEGQL